MDLANLSRLLWREREMLDTLLFKLHEQQLLLMAGHSEWLPRAGREIDAVLQRIGEIELRRALEFETAATGLGLQPNPSLRVLAATAPEPWGHLLEEHHRAFIALAARIQQVSDANRELAATAMRATDAIIESMEGGRRAPETYVPSGRVEVPHRRRAALVDEEM